MKPEIKKQIILHLPYLAFVYLFGKVGQAFRLAQGADLSAKLLHIGQGFSAAFASAAPSFHPTDLLIGLAAAVIIRLVVYSKQKNAKKYRKGMEYGTARWGTAADIKPFIDPVFDNNVLLTQTERLMMSNRPKDPKNARNKNILVIGGSGSGKTRFFCKPNIMQLHSSYVICVSRAAKPLSARHTGTLSRDYALAFSYPVRVGAAHRPRGTPDRKLPSPKWDHAPK